MKLHMVYICGRFQSLATLCQVTVLLSALVSGCSGVYGNFRYDEAVDDTFENLTVLPDHQYYFTGPDSYPNVVIAIDEHYSLASNIWKPIDITRDQLKHWVYNPLRSNRYYPYPYGRRILDDKGNEIGVWYALKDYRLFASIRMLDDTTVQLSKPFDESDRFLTPLKRRRFGDD
ncbi:MAG: hypothetical protein P8010_17535 [Desulfosarcinaceae bacterium]